jgi:hypothetical protein
VYDCCLCRAVASEVVAEAAAPGRFGAIVAAASRDVSDHLAEEDNPGDMSFDGSFLLEEIRAKD